MRPLACVALAGAIAVVVSGCGLSKEGLQAAGITDQDGGAAVPPAPIDGGATPGEDAGVDATGPAIDAAADAPAAPPPLDDASLEDAAASPCVAAIPAGWSLVAYEPSQDACPTGFGGGHDEYSGATTVPAACACGCQVTTAPSCTSGTVSTFYGTIGTTCPTTGASFTVSGSACTALPAAGGLALNFEATTVPLSGGACTGTPQPAPAQVTKDAVRYCDVPSSSAESVCEGTVSPGFAACVVAEGDIACPAGSPFATKRVVADDEVLSCSACTTCTVGGTCASPTVTFYSDGMCTQQVVQLAANGTCAPSNAAGRPVVAVEYTAQLVPTCQASGSTPSVAPNGEHTLCCR